MCVCYSSSQSREQRKKKKTECEGVERAVKGGKNLARRRDDYEGTGKGKNPKTNTTRGLRSKDSEGASIEKEEWGGGF